MKIDNQNTQPVDKPDDAQRKQPDDADDEDGFKKLLERKREDKKEGDEKKRSSGDKKDKKGAKGKKGKFAKAGKQKPFIRGGEFGARVRDGRLQQARQEKRHTFVQAEQHEKRTEQERRLDSEKNQRHFRDVEQSHARKEEQRSKGQRARAGRGQAQKANAAPGQASRGRASERGAEEGDGRIDKFADKAAAGEKAARAEEAGQMRRSEMREEIAQLADKLVEKAQIGQDAAGRQIMMLDLQVPDRGNVRVRLRRRGDGFEVRMRADNEDLSRDLRREREQFRQAASDKGVEFTSIEIA